MQNKTTKTISWVLIALALIGLATQLIPAITDYFAQAKIAVTYPFSIDYGEGPLLDQTLRLTKFENIYHNSFSTPPYTISNYPPLFLIFQTPFASIFGAAFWYGRSIAILGILLTALFICLTLQTLTHDWVSSVIAGLLLVAFPYVQHWSMFNRIDELALVFSWAALFVIVRCVGRSPFPAGEKPSFMDLAKSVLRAPHFWLASLLFVASIYSRQTYAFAAPAAAFFWLIFGAAGTWRQRITRAVMLGVVVGGITLALFLLINWITAGGFYLNIITANVNAFYWETVKHYANEILDRLWPLLALAGFFLLAEAIHSTVKWVKRRGEQASAAPDAPAAAFTPSVTAWALVLPYLLASVIGSITIGKDGSNVNYLLELSAALCLAGGAALAWGVQWKRWYVSTPIRIAIIALIAVQAAIMVDWTRSDFKPQIDRLPEQQPIIAAVEHVIQTTPGIVIADEYMGLVPLAGKELYFQPFEFKQMADAKIWDETPFVNEIYNHKFDLIVWYQPVGWDAIKARYTPAQIEAVESAYKLDRLLGDIYLYRPKK